MKIHLEQIVIAFLIILIFYSVGFSQTAEEFFKNGKEHQSKREYKLAADAFGEAIKLKPDYAEAYFERGRTNQMSKGENYPYSFPLWIYDPTVKSIFKDFQQAIYLSPNVANYYYHRGLNYYAVSKFSEAIEDYTKAIALAPDRAEGYRVRFESYFQQDDFDKALSDINKAIELQPNALLLYYGRGELYLSKGDCKLLEKAINDFSFIIARNPNFPAVYSKRAEAYKELAECSRRMADDYNHRAENESRKGDEISGSFLNPRAQFLAQPVYPKNLIPLRLTDKVTVNVTVSGYGNVIKAMMLYGDSRFKEAAESAALATRFPPTIIDGKPTETWGVLEFNFIPPVQGIGPGIGTGSGNGARSKGYFVTEYLRTRRYLPGDTEPLAKDKPFILGELDLPTTNPATLFVGEKPPVEPLDTPFEIINSPKPIMTKEARENNVQGIVILRVKFLADGKIGSIDVVSGLPYGLTEQAISAAKQIKFIPATKKGIPITVTKVFQYSFRIK